MNLDPHNLKKIPRQWGNWRKQVGIAAILMLATWKPAIGASDQCLMALGMDGIQATMISQYRRGVLSLAIQSGQIDLAKMILACSNFKEKDFEYYIEMANIFDQDDIEELLKQHRRWQER